MLRILCIDDETIVRVALSTIIDWEVHGYQLIGTAADGLQALQLIEQQQPDIIITDLKMPNMSGLELIHHLADQAYKGKIIVLSNYGDYELVREAMKGGAVDYLLKVTLIPDELLTVLAKTRDLIYEEREEWEQHLSVQHQLSEQRQAQYNRIWQELLYEDEQQLPSIIREAIQLDMNIHPTTITGTLFYIKIDNYQEALATGKLKNKKLLQFSVANIVKEIISNHSAIHLIELTGGQYAVILLNNNNIDNKQLAIRLVTLVSTYLNLSVSVIIGDNFNNLQQLRLQFDDCKRASQATFYKGTPLIIAAHEVAFNNEYCKIAYTRWMTTIKQAVESNSNTIATDVQTIIGEATTHFCLPEQLKEYAHILVTELESHINHLVKQEEVYDLTNLSFMRSEAYCQYKKQLIDTTSIQHFSNYLILILEMITEQFALLKQQVYRKEVIQIMSILHEKFHERLTLEHLASTVNLNTSYLCRIFKQDTGKSIFQYMNELKVNEAVQLLQQKDIRVKEVAALVGIDDPFYFNRIFKKMTGVSPSEYRKKHNA
ncbi:response regulator [Paenibacillus yanchengensis]|uniref:Response regulator n=1 Tax=Paenibacillus yanchengensis TaxID=2035833 RepID=A0ABW4YFU9_9BACL